MGHPAFQEKHAFVGDYGYSRWDRIRVAREEVKAQQSIAELLNQQAKDWNAGDLAAFTSIYADDALVVSPSGLKRGRENILKRYQKKYDTAEKRGRLTLEVIETRIVRGPQFTEPLGAVPDGFRARARC